MLIRSSASRAAWRRRVGVAGVVVLVGTLLIAAGATAQQQTDPLTINDPTAGESAGSIRFTVVNRAAIDGNEYPGGVEVGYNTSNRSARDDSDYTYTSGTLVFTSVGQSLTITVPLLSDDLDEDDETFVVYLDDPRDSSAFMFGTGTIADDDAAPVLTLTPEENVTTERGAVLQYQLTLSEASGRPVRVAYEVLPGLKSISGGGQLTNLPDSDCGSFTANDVCQKATPVADYEPVSGQTWRADSTPGDTTDDVLEGVYVFQPGETGGPAVGSTLDFSEIQIYAVDDSDVDVNDRDETLTIRLLSDPTFTFASTADQIAHGLILDDDLPRVSFSQWGYGPENGITSALGVSISPVVPAGGDPVTVKVRSVHGNRIPGNFSLQDEGEAVCSATPGEDFEDVQETLTFGPGDRSKRVEYEEYDDDIAEPIERYCLELYDVSRNGILELEPIWYNVVYDDDPPPLVTVSSPTASEQDGRVTFEVNLTRRGTETVEFDYETVDGTAVATTQSDTGDYTSAAGTLSFPANETAPKSVTIQLEHDSLDEPNEQFELVVSGTDSGVEVSRGTATIIDSDDPPRLSVTPARADEDATGGQIDFTVTLAGASSRPVTVTYSTGVATGDTATEGTTCNTAGVDYIATSSTLQFQALQTGSQTVSVPICDDDAYEGNETFTLTLTSPVNADLASNAAAKGTIVDNERPPSLSVDDVTGEEDDGSLEFTVSLGSQAGSAVTVDYETEQHTGGNPATEGSDCTVDGADFDDESGTLTFNPGDVTQSVTVSLCADNLDEQIETFRFKLSNASGAPISRSAATGTIEDSDPEPELYVTDAAGVDEDAGPAEFTVTLTAASAKTVTVRYATTGGTAVGGSSCTSGRDFRNTSGTLTFRPGEPLTQDVDVPICNDSLDEEDSETFRLLLSNPRKATLQFGADGATGTIYDDDDPPTLSISGGTAREDATALNPGSGVVFTISLDAASGRDVSVDYRTFDDTDDTAESGSDYSATSGSLTIDAGRRSATVTVPVLNDTLAEDAETFTMELTNPTNAGFTGQAGFVSAKGTITDDNDPAVDLQIQNVTVNEGGTATFTVTLAAVSGQEVTVNWETVNGTATGDIDCNGDGDFTENSGTLTFQAGNTAPDEADPAVVICEDDLHEPAETFGLRLRIPTNATAPADPATGLINDNDGPPALSVDGPRVLEGAGKVTFTVTLDPVSGKDVTVKYATADGTAEAGRDYTARSGSLTIPAGETSETVDVPVSDDATSEPEEETFTLVLSDPQNAIGDGASGTATIVDDDGDPSFSVRDATAAEGNADGVLTFTVQLSAATDQEATVDYATSGGTATSGTDCAASGDFEATSGTLTFSSGDPLTQTVSVPICDDSLFESNETFTLTLSNPVNAVVGGNTATATGTIIDDEQPPSLSIGNVTADEDDGVAQLTVTLSPTHSEQVTVNYATADGTATGGADCAIDGVDFVTVAATELVFAPNEGTRTIDVEICDDDVHEERVEKFTVQLSGQQNAGLSDSSGEVQIVDEEDPPELSFQSDDVTVDEADGSIAFVVELSGPSEKTVTVKYATADGSATAPADFTAPPSNATLSFAPGVTSQTITLAVADDSLDEADEETFTLTLSEPTNATLADEDATGRITDDDDPPELSVSGGSVAEDITERNQNNGLVFTVSLDAESGRDVSVAYTTVSGTATEGEDFTATFGTLVIPAGEDEATITVPILDDALDEDDETFTLQLSSEQNATLDTGAGDDAATGTIADNDANAELSVENARATEGGSITFTVILDPVKATDVEVGYSTSNGSATGGADCSGSADYVQTSGTLTIAAQGTTETITVETCTDGINEPEETFELRLTSSDAIAPSDSATGIVEDGNALPQLSVNDPAAVAEGNPGTNVPGGRVAFEVTLSPASGRAVTVDYATMGGTATEGVDYTAKSGTLTFAAGETAKTVEVAFIKDLIDEDDESFALELSNPTNAEFGDDSGAATITDDDGEPGLSVNDPTVRESDGIVTFTLTLSRASSKTVTLSYYTQSGTAVAYEDYLLVQVGRFEFAPGEVTKTVDVVLVNDTLVEDDETFELQLSQIHGAPLNAIMLKHIGVATIRDDDRGSGGGGSGGGGTGGTGGGGGGPVVSTSPAAAPRIGIFMKDVVLVINEPPLEIDLVASVVGAIDSYQALAANPGIVTAVVSGSKLTLAPEALGVTTVSVSAKNSRGSVFQSFRVTVIERGAPKFASLLPNRVLYIGDPPDVVDVSPAFTGTVSSFTAGAGDPNLVGVATTGSQLSLTGLAPGVTTVTVRAVNASGVAMQSFRVAVLSRQTPGAGPPGPAREIPTH